MNITCAADTISHPPLSLAFCSFFTREKPKKKDRGKARVRPTVDRMKLVEDMSRIATKLCPTDADLLLGPNLRVGTYHTGDSIRVSCLLHLSFLILTTPRR